MAERLQANNSLELSALLEYAALSGPFDPAEAIRRIGVKSVGVATAAASALSLACDTNPNQTTEWLMLGAKREDVLRNLKNSGTLPAAIERRRTGPIDEATHDLLSAIERTDQFRPESLRQLLNETEDIELVSRVATALDRAKAVLSDLDVLAVARTKMLNLVRKIRRDRLQERGFYGRTREIAYILTRIQRKNQTRSVRPIWIWGLPGIGKSALLEEVISRDVAQRQTLIVRLDFDRSGLDANNPRTLTMEVARQLVDRVGDAGVVLDEERLLAASDGDAMQRSRRGGQRSFPNRLASTIGLTLDSQKRPLLIVIDTLEALAARGRHRVDQLIDWLDRLKAESNVDFSILIAGRSSPEQVFGISTSDSAIRLDGLDQFAIDQFLDAHHIPRNQREAICKCTKGNPLALRLATSIVRNHGAESLPAKSLHPELAAAMLYRILLSRIEDDTLRRLADPGLIVRRISAELLVTVIGPAVDLPNLTDTEGEELFSALARQHWLVEPDPGDPDFVRHRRDMRALLLPLLYQESEKVCYRIDKAASRWFGQRTDTASQIDALYHRLQQSRRAAVRPAIPAEIAQYFDSDMVAELPERAQIAVRQAAGKSVASFTAATGGGLDDRELINELERIIASREWHEGLSLTDHFLADAPIDPVSPLADTVRALWWRAGRWSDAYWLMRERDKLGYDDSDLVNLPPIQAAARVEMRFEMGKGRSLLDDEHAWSKVDSRAFDAMLGQSGAMAFMASTREPPIEGLHSETPYDVLEAALARWMGTGDSGAWHGAVGYGRERIGGQGVHLRYPMPDWTEAQLLSTLTPYVGFVAALGEVEQGILSHAEQASVSLATSQDSPLTLTRVMEPAPQLWRDGDPLGTIADLGLFAEWADALAFVTRNANLRTIARSAERWRRTVAGQWSFGHPPRLWGRRMPLDGTLSGRTNAILESSDPIRTAFDQCHAWVPHLGSGEELVDRVIQRNPAAMKVAQQAHDPFEVAAILYRRRLPSAFIPSLAVLICHGPIWRGYYAHD